MQTALIDPTLLATVPTVETARRLLGALLVRDTPHGSMVGRIVETEAYGADDPACHGVRVLPDGTTVHRHTPRNAAMFGPPGRAYVYFTYGAHYLLNVVTQPEGIPEAVLLRALEPVEGMTIMQAHRGACDPRHLTNGPGKLAQALQITRELNEHDLTCAPLQLLMPNTPPAESIIVTTRIGISSATERPWRFYLAGNPWVSQMRHRGA